MTLKDDNSNSNICCTLMSLKNDNIVRLIFMTVKVENV